MQLILYLWYFLRFFHDPYAKQTTFTVQIPVKVTYVKKNGKNGKQQSILPLCEYDDILKQKQGENGTLKHTGVKTAQQYQELLENHPEISTRAELARYLGVSRARVTQVLKKTAQ